MKLTDKNNNPIQKKVAIKCIKKLIHFFENCISTYFDNTHGICDAIKLLNLNLVIDYSDTKKRYKRGEKSDGTIFKESDQGNYFFESDMDRIEYLTRILINLENEE